jgi:hypothetical protein
MNSLLNTCAILFMSSLIFGDDHAQARAKNIYQPPFNAGIWFVVQGGDTINVNHHQAVESQFFGVDLAMTKERSLSNGSGNKLSDYHSFKQSLTSPCNGTVIDLMNDAKDNAIGTSDEKNIFGNYVIIDAGNNEYVVLAHILQGSIIPKIWAGINAGDLIGLIGNSGSTTMPHIHMHIQDSKILNDGSGLLFEFSNAKGTVSGRTIKNTPLPLINGMWIEFVPPKK